LLFSVTVGCLQEARRLFVWRESMAAGFQPVTSFCAASRTPQRSMAATKSSTVLPASQLKQ